MTTLPRIRHTSAPTPEGCRWCGWPYRGHVQQWVPGRGWHGWEHPTRQQITARMRARMQARRGAVAGAAPTSQDRLAPL